MREFGLTVSLGAVGAGEVNQVLPPDLLLPPEPRALAPLSPGSINCQLLNAVAKPRQGYAVLGDRPTSTAVTGLYQVLFDNNTTEYLRGDQTGMRYLTGGVWTSITAAGTGGNWCFAMVRRAGGTTIANQVMFSADGDGDSVWRYRGAGAAAATVGAGVFQGAVAIVGHKGRALVMNVYDVGAGARKLSRIYMSINGDPETYTGTGSGYVDLDDEPYPIVNGLVISGNVCVFKGNNIGGAITVGTLTGNVNTPYRWDTINTGNVGLLVPRSLVQVNPDLAFFLGHDGFYVYDGGRGISRVADGVGQAILQRINPAALDTGFSEFFPATGEILTHLATGASTYPNETWVFNIKEKRVYGPYTYTNNLTASSSYATTSTLTWDTIPFSAWDSMTYSTWDTMGGIASRRGVTYGDDSGYVYSSEVSNTTDNGTAISSQYVSGAIRAEGRKLLLPNGQTRELEVDSVLTLRDVTLTYINNGEWTPLVDVSLDGGLTWETISDGTVIGSGSTNLGRYLNKSYTVLSGLSGTWFQLRVTTTSPNMQLMGIRFELTYGGNDRNS